MSFRISEIATVKFNASGSSVAYLILMIPLGSEFVFPEIIRINSPGGSV